MWKIQMPYNKELWEIQTVTQGWGEWKRCIAAMQNAYDLCVTIVFMFHE